MKKRLLSAVLALLLSVSMIISSTAATTGLGNFKKSNTYYDGMFTDVKSSEWFADSVKSVYEYGLMVGKGKDTFDPNGNITFAEVVTIAARLHSVYHTGKSSFETTEPWYEAYTRYFSESDDLKTVYSSFQGISMSYPATRYDVADIFANIFPENEYAEINFVEEGAIPDVSISHSEVYKLYRSGILTGSDTRGTFNGGSSITRAEIAAIIVRMINKSIRRGIALKVSDLLVKGSVYDVSVTDYKYTYEPEIRNADFVHFSCNCPRVDLNQNCTFEYPKVAEWVSAYNYECNRNAERNRSVYVDDGNHSADYIYHAEVVRFDEKVFSFTQNMIYKWATVEPSENGTVTDMDIVSVNFNPQTGKEYTLTDVVKNKKKFWSVATKLFKEKNTGYDYPEDDFVLNSCDYWQYGKNGITLWYVNLNGNEDGIKKVTIPFAAYPELFR